MRLVAAHYEDIVTGTPRTLLVQWDEDTIKDLNEFIDQWGDETILFFVSDYQED